MKISCEVMILKVGEIKNSKNGEPYFMLEFADMDGDVFSIMVKDISRYNEFKPFNKSELDLQLKNNVKYGLSLKIIS